MAIGNIDKTGSLNDRVLKALDRIVYRLAVTSEERDAIFGLRYRAYLREGAISPNVEERFSDPVDGLPNCLHLGVFADGEMAGSIRLNVSVPGMPPIPTAKVFPEFLGPRLEAGEVIVDPTRFVADARWSREIPVLPYLTLRLPWLAMAHFDAGIMLAAVRPEHYPFYRRLWGNEEVCPARFYPGLAKPVLLSMLDHRAARAGIEERYPFFKERDGECESIFGKIRWAPGGRRDSRAGTSVLT